MFRPEGLEYRGGTWDRIYDALQKEYPIEARITRVTWEHNTPVWELDLEVARGLVPSSETGLESHELMQKFTGQKVFVKVKGVDKKAGIVVCSRREAVADTRVELLKHLKVGQELDAVIRVVTPKRLTVDIGGGVLVDVPRANATKSRALRLNELFEPGRQVSVRVSALDGDKDIILVTMVDGSSPWERAPEFRRGDCVAGIVVRADSRFVMIEMVGVPGLVGLAPPPLRGNLSRGDRVTCMVTNLSREKNKLSLRLRGTMA